MLIMLKRFVMFMLLLLLVVPLAGCIEGCSLFDNLNLDIPADPGTAPHHQQQAP